MEDALSGHPQSSILKALWLPKPRFAAIIRAIQGLSMRLLHHGMKGGEGLPAPRKPDPFIEAPR
jgi:hypothetical protein